MQYRSREDIVSTVDTWTNLNSEVDDSSAGKISVPQGVSQIAQIIAAIGLDGAAATGAVVLLKLSGDGLQKGEQTLVIGAAAWETAAGIQSLMAASIPVQIGVIPGNNIQVSAAFVAGADIGNVHVGATLGFA